MPSVAKEAGVSPVPRHKPGKVLRYWHTMHLTAKTLLETWRASCFESFPATL